MRVEADLHSDDSSHRVQSPGDDIYNLTVHGIWSFTRFTLQFVLTPLHVLLIICLCAQLCP